MPEVEVVRRGLAEHITGRRIAAVQVHSDRAVRRHPGGRNDFAAVLAGRTIEQVRRRGKYLWLVLDDGDAVLAHLGMSGQFRVGAGAGARAGAGAASGGVRAGAVRAGAAGRGAAPLHPHLRIRFDFADDGPHLDFLDQRTFGGMAFSPGGAELPAEIAHIGRDPLDPLFDRDAAVRAIRGKHTELKRVLLDQTVVSGIGNIYADEALWRAKLHYRRQTDRLPRPAVRAVLDAATEVMTAALAVGGTSFDALYVNVNGESGYFDRTLDAYGREGLPCRRCGHPIRREAFMNRSSFLCRVCQRPGRS
nr:bifunctional DNA-formamidopyrimidine glycosylase/DNA-(apurinic or apyrimidinic site) lyase [Nakamurella aerolata]